MWERVGDGGTKVVLKNFMATTAKMLMNCVHTSEIDV